MNIFIGTILATLFALFSMLVIGFIKSKRNAVLKQQNSPLRAPKPVSTHHIVSENKAEKIAYMPNWKGFDQSKPMTDNCGKVNKQNDDVDYTVNVTHHKDGSSDAS